MEKKEEDLQARVRAFATKYLGRELKPGEHASLDALVADWARTPGVAASQVDATLRESRRAMAGTLASADALARSQLDMAAAGADGEAHALARLLDKADGLGDLRPSKLTPTAVGAQGHLVIAQIADRLANLVKQEVEARFQEHFAPLARQVERALAGLDAATPSAPHPSPSPPGDTGSPTTPAPASGGAPAPTRRRR
ncbi:hypothetical protein [Marilutibacter aestuarii]|uniref:Uncharacterized protein n=1 Tax=Marilutibacter aestuarii TaxID=1706195 RepID=A0A507ZWD6_9GAMM|nr:hypothetical protein [Lysobacter aestuarii]TQD41819.1 hypothetical protein FKV25_12525 [Lysobacter aestuarii]